MNGVAQRVRLLLSALCLLGLLASCAASTQEVRQRDEALCANYGFRPGSPDFATCLQQEDLWRRHASEKPLWASPFFLW